METLKTTTSLHFKVFFFINVTPKIKLKYISYQVRVKTKMEGFKRALSCAEIEFDECKKDKRNHLKQKNKNKKCECCRLQYILFEHDYKIKHLWVLLLKSIVNDSHMTYYLSICKKLVEYLHECVDVEGLNTGQYLDWTAHLKRYKDAFDDVVDDYTEYKIQQIKVTYLNKNK